MTQSNDDKVWGCLVWFAFVLGLVAGLSAGLSAGITFTLKAVDMYYQSHGFYP